MSKAAHIGMTESALDRRERLLNAYTKPKRPVSENVRINNENQYTTRKEYPTTNQAFGAVW
ncbi:hypothetical protein GAP52_109 [Cronobacter phage vB_CsaP_GAP52]|uniref:Uncharacterized protein n=1 Tax=Cronobacter phage vB_CsaP_GAP52 TaxID=1141137 RepID=K4F7I2_9CAUD|nr:hypothetical protein D858_gp005 [Cronobacter phage vB_CsaP_GAP52]AFC22103.1 hypothetical protein GAP52_109 [Cronobacter phage vB_CsaP_GAP52]